MNIIHEIAKDRKTYPIVKEVTAGTTKLEEANLIASSLEEPDIDTGDWHRSNPDEARFRAAKLLIKEELRQDVGNSFTLPENFSEVYQDNVFFDAKRNELQQALAEAKQNVENKRQAYDDARFVVEVIQKTIEERLDIARRNAAFATRWYVPASMNTTFLDAVKFLYGDQWPAKITGVIRANPNISSLTDTVISAIALPSTFFDPKQPVEAEVGDDTEEHH